MVLQIPYVIMVGIVFALMVMETPFKEFLWDMSIVYAIGSVVIMVLYALGFRKDQWYFIHDYVYILCAAFVILSLLVFFPIGEPSVKWHCWALLFLIWLTSNLTGVFRDVWGDRLWRLEQQPCAEGYHPNNKWEYTEEPSEPSETNSQTPPDCRP